MSALIHDLRYALRTLWRSPGFTAVAVLTLALGIGANTAIFSVLDAVLIRPLPYPDPDRVVVAWQAAEEGETTWLSAPEVLGYGRDGSRAFAGFAGYDGFEANLTGDGEPERIPAAYLLPEGWSVLGTEPALGRTFGAEAEAAEAVVLSDALWRRRFGADPGVLGSSIQVNGEPRTVIGVMPPDFRLPLDFPEERPAELWAPLVFDPDDLSSWGSRYLIGFGRLQDGVSPEAAGQEMARVEAEWLSSGVMQRDDKLRRQPVPVRELVFGSARPALLVVSAAVGLVLLIACANVAGLLLARADRRRREVAVRSALGAGPGRLLRQLLTESVVLGLAGAAGGTVLARGALALLVAARPAGLPRVEQVELHAGVLGFAAALGVLTGVLFGAAPALRLLRPELARTLREGGRGTVGGGRQAGRRALVVAEVALSVILVVAAGLLIRSFAEMQRIPLGFRPDGVLTVQLAPPQADYPEPTDVTGFYARLLDEVRTIPGVQVAAATRILPLTGTIGDWSITLEGKPRAPADNPNGDWQVVTPGYFEAMGMTLERGRWLASADDAAGVPVVVVNRTMAERYWPGEEAVGKRFHLGTGDQPWMTIVGVAAPVRHNAVIEEERAEMYVPHAQFPLSTGSAPRNLTLVLRTAGDPLALLPAVREAVRAQDPNVPLAQARTLEQVVGRALARPRLIAALLAVFAGVALLLAALGIYGVLTLLVAQRRQEIGIRMALGADRASVLRRFVGDGMTLALGGALLGMLGAAASARLLAGLMYGVGPLDPLTFLTVPPLLVGVALLACWLPARRAASVDPIVALRTE